MNLQNARCNNKDMLMCVPFLVSCVLGLVISPEEGSNLLRNGSVLFLSFV
jgi:hypothetical protein